jgi:cyclohexyl-isocyanide hydratase
MTHTPTRIVIPLFDKVTQLDFTGPHQVFSYVPDATIIVASIGGRDIATKGMVFGGLADLSKVESCDLLCVPGGSGVGAAMLDEVFIREVRRLANGATYLTSVCSGSLILAAAGLLKGKRAATHWARREILSLLGAVVDDGRVVRDGNIITGGGVTAGIDFALIAVAEIFGRSTAEAIELMMEYAPQPPFSVGRPDQAPPDLVQKVREYLSPAETAMRESIARINKPQAA